LPAPRRAALRVRLAPLSRLTVESKLAAPGSLLRLRDDRVLTVVVHTA
jgi:hypothetical protein